MVKLAKLFFKQAAKLRFIFCFYNVKLNVRHIHKESMIIFKHSSELNNYLEKFAKSSKFIGFVPTMGALHDGHLSLLTKSKEFSQLTVCSIFVNPVQFNNPEDFRKYPKTIEKDILLLEEHGCDILFIPTEKEIYPDESSKKKYYNLGHLEKILEGKYRPGHFQGVSLIVDKLLSIVIPDFIFIGQKDFQQCLIIERLIELSNRKTKVVICPILRESSGLAMSSRNLRLNIEEKKIAAELHSSLVFIKDNLTPYNFSTLKKNAISKLQSKGFKVEYLEMAERSTLEIVNKSGNADELVILTAAFLNDVRLIDNLLIKE
jgi:pantoate--beta-alanine ligase